jgi:hypothetical protein
MWVDQVDGEELSLSELARRHHIPQKLLSDLPQDFPGDFSALISGID